MGSQELKLLLTTCNFWLLSPSSSSELWLLSLATAITGTGMEDTEEGTEAMAAMAMATMATTARGPLMLSLRLRLMLSPPPMLSPAMVTMVMVMEDTEEVITVTAMVMVMGTTVEKNPEVHVDSIRIEFSANEFGPLWY